MSGSTKKQGHRSSHRRTKDILSTSPKDDVNLGSLDMTEEETDVLLNEAYELNQRLKEQLQEQIQASSSYKEDEEVMSGGPVRMPSATESFNRLQVQFGSRESLSGSLPPIVGSSGQYSAKAYGARKQLTEMHSPQPMYHARLQFSVGQ